ncbi:ankyrin [Neofusicoccum parvum]|uniref:Ankyrin, partial n=1 Tax=Neofusicoccum parvum TaxID=310453 RepID=A0ACB5S5M2_9PEZI|nr:ankyrin [Neofusicoccum parvum]
MVEELENDQGRPTDIGPDGSTLAYVAVAYHQYEALQLLLNIGVDPHWENDFQQSAYDRAWEGVFVQDSPGKAKPSDAMSTSIFHDKTRMLEDWGLTRLHKIILGLETGDIEAELRSGASINATDRFNRTPLFWASGRGDLDAVRLLLDRGADPNITDTEGSTALRRCHGNQRLDIAQLLVSRGADVHWRNKLGMGGLHSVASYGMPVEWFSLYSACDTEQTNLTPLAIACKYNRPLHASWLLAHGASPHTPLSASDPTSTLLHHTVAADHPACVALLLQHAAATTADSLPVLLAAAARASTPTLDALAAHAYGALAAAAAVVDPAVRHVLAAGAGWLPGEKPALRRVLLTRWCGRCGMDARAGVPAELSLREEEGGGVAGWGRVREGGRVGVVALGEGGGEEEEERRRRGTPHRHGLEVPPWVFGTEVFEAGEEVEWVVHEGKVLQRFVMIGGYVTDMWTVRAVLPGHEMETGEEDDQGSGVVN